MLPIRTAEPPKISKYGLTLLNISSLPPTIIESVPFIAPGSPPDTGASRKSTPKAASFSA